MSPTGVTLPWQFDKKIQNKQANPNANIMNPADKREPYHQESPQEIMPESRLAFAILVEMN
jgi:hypothetical protein